MKAYTKPIAEVKEFGLSAAIADLGEWLAAEGAALGVSEAGNAIASYTYAS